MRWSLGSHAPGLRRRCQSVNVTGCDDGEGGRGLLVNSVMLRDVMRVAVLNNHFGSFGGLN